MPREVHIPNASQFADQQLCTFGPSWRLEASIIMKGCEDEDCS